jgi:hypothetical protein
MNKIICDSMDSWLARRPVTLPVWTGRNEPIHGALRRAFCAQEKIRWDQFFHGRNAKDWKQPITMYYKIRQPGESYMSDQWMWTIIKELWILSITIRKQWNRELHGADSALSLEQWCKEAATAAANVYHHTIRKISPMDRIILHHTKIKEILKWNQEHLDAYLHRLTLSLSRGTSRIELYICIYFYYLGCITAHGVGWELYGSSRCSVLAIIGIFKFQFYIKPFM